MAVQTIHVVQSFSVNEFKEYGADEPRVFQTADQAIQRANRVHDSGKPVLAFSRSGDPKIGEYGEADIIAKLGDIPEDIIEAFCASN